MKKYIIASLALLFLTACEYKEDPVFDQNPKERILSSLQNTRKLLEGHDGYWLLTYYPEDYQEVFGCILTYQLFSLRQLIFLSITAP